MFSNNNNFYKLSKLSSLLLFRCHFNQIHYISSNKNSTIKQIQTFENSILINWTNNNNHKNNNNNNNNSIFSKFNYLWLRDNCQCSECIHPDSRQKLFSSGQIPLDIKPILINVVNNKENKDEEEIIEITWNKSLLKSIPSINSLNSLNSFNFPNNSPSNSPINLQQKGKDDDEKTHKSKFPISFLFHHNSKHSSNQFRFNNLKPITWNRDSIIESKNLWINYNDFMNSDIELLKCLKQLWDYGLVFLKNVPINKLPITEENNNMMNNDQGIINVVERIGTIRSTFYGKIFDVISIPGAKNIAYTNLSLGLHMDLLYYQVPPGLQFLHCLKNSVKGGSSIFADSFKAIENFKNIYPQDFDILTKIPLTFHYINDGHHMHYNQYVIELDKDVDKDDNSNNPIISVNYSPPFQGPIEALLPSSSSSNNNNIDDYKDEKDEEDDDKRIFSFYQAYQRFCAFIEDPELKYELTLKPGDLVIVINRRVLHGRNSFDADSGERYLKGAYLELCEFKDKFRVLMKKYNQFNN
ncbi:hypothetical protein Glove_508g53 [Diversispora epigaea]|uniref:TauD/TfdA-like domain-containing protein n=1 Tax=Diversispora epigaea TaxID=1348612 RepID=A0A397GG49_9GLOM|nr:hypothetical protein Glove_508g53 [Diversispora epigaea]